MAWLPLRLVLPREGLPFSVLEVDGPVWAGMLRQVQWQGSAFGDVTVRPRAWALLPGERQVHLQTTQLQVLLVDGTQHGIGDAQGQLLLRQPAGMALIDLALERQQKARPCTVTSGLDSACQRTLKVMQIHLWSTYARDQS